MFNFDPLNVEKILWECGFVRGEKLCINMKPESVVQARIQYKG